MYILFECLDCGIYNMCAGDEVFGMPRCIGCGNRVVAVCKGSYQKIKEYSRHHELLISKQAIKQKQLERQREQTNSDSGRKNFLSDF